MEADWQVVEHHLQRLLDLAPAARQSYLRETCAGRPELRKSLETFLALEHEVGSFLEASPLPPSPFVPVSETRPVDGPQLHVDFRAGQRIGPYRVVRILGRGGMSTVYSAHEGDHGSDQMVAVKVVQSGFHSGDVLRRFIDEQWILGQLDHPNIARLFDGGTTEQGLPYFVMEAIDGLPIDAYCDRRRLTVRQRLGLFRRVCAAVHYAHQNLVVHRDIKPSNILVTEDGIPKLLDFGIAKVLRGGGATGCGEPTLTFHMRAMTPSYASPEQIRGQTITTASDIYSLGVLLYRLTTGRLPFHFPSHLPVDIDRVLRDTKPLLPSEAVLRREEGLDPQEVAAQRGVTAEKLSRRLRGDLDNMILMALRREPRRRYGSAEQLAEDLRRLSAGQPVSARPDVAVYRARKFLGRHKLGVLVAVAAMLLLLTIAVLSAVHVGRLRLERQQTEQVAEFLISLYEMSTPVSDEGDSIAASELLDRGARRVLDGEDLQPEVRATLLHNIGRGFTNLRLYHRAVPLFEEALASRRRAMGQEDSQTAATWFHLAVARWGAGEYQASDEAFAKALALERRRTADSTAVADILSGLFSLLHDSGDYQGAEKVARQALDIRQRKLGADHPKTAESKVLLASLLNDLEVYDEAERLYREALITLRRHGTAQELASALDGLGILLVVRGDPAAARSLVEEGMELRRASLGVAHPGFAESLSILAFVRQELGDLEAAEELQRQSLQVFRDHYPDGHLSISKAEYNLALILSERGTYAAAEALFRKALEAARRSFGEQNVRYAAGQTDLAWVLLAQGERAEAETLYRQAIATLEIAPISELHQFAALARMGLGRLLCEGERLAEGEALLQSTRQSLKSALGDNHWRTAQAESELGACLLGLGRTAEARSLLQRSHRLLTQQRGENSQITRRAAELAASLPPSMLPASSASP